MTASVGICLAIGVSLNSLRLRAWARATFLLFYLLLAYVVSGNHLRYNLIEAQSPDFFYTVAMLERLPGPLLTLEPIYAVFAQKTITPFYMMADPRYYDVANRTIPDSLQFALIAQSQTILLDNHTRALLSQDSILQIQATHQFVGLFGESEIWSVPH